MSRPNTKQILACGSFAVAAVIAVVSLFIPPKGEIDSSALWAVAQFLVMVCTLLELQASIEKFVNKK